MWFLTLGVIKYFTFFWGNGWKFCVACVVFCVVLFDGKVLKMFKHYLVRVDKIYVLGCVYHVLKDIKFWETARNIYFCMSCLKLVDFVKNTLFLCVWTYFYLFDILLCVWTPWSFYTTAHSSDQKGCLDIFFVSRHNCWTCLNIIVEHV